MRPHRFQSCVTAGRHTLPAAIGLSLFCWVTAAWLMPAGNGMPVPAGSLWPGADADGLPQWASLLAGYLLYSLAGYLLIILNNQFALIRTRASMQTSVYLLLAAACPVLHPLHAGSVAAVLLPASLLFLLGSYRQEKTAGNLFHAFAFLGLGSMAVPQLLYLVPVFWIGTYSFNALHPKSFTASLLGITLPYWFLLGHAYCHGQMELFYRPFRGLVAFGPWLQGWRPELAATVAYLSVLLIISAIHCQVAWHEDKIRTRCSLHFLLFLCCCLTVFLILQPAQAISLLPVLLTAACIPVGHFFVLTSSHSSNVFFIAALAGLSLLFGFNVWMRL